MSEAFHLYVISFTVGAESGLAMVAAPSDRDAFQILKNGGSRHCEGYSLVQTRDIGMTANCHYGLLMESFVNAIEAYNAIISYANRFIKGEKGDKGDKGDKGEDGQSIYYSVVGSTLRISSQSAHVINETLVL